MFGSLLVAGLTMGPLGVVRLGVAIFKTPAFGRVLGSVSVAATAPATVLLIDPESAVAVVGVFALILVHIAVGGRVYSLSKRR